MELTHYQYERIAPHLPVQWGNVGISNRQVLNAILYVAEHGCKWRGLPKRFGNWHTIYTRMSRWSKNGVVDNGPQSIGRCRGGWTTNGHRSAAAARTAVTFSFSPAQAHDGPQGRKLLNRLGQQQGSPSLIMDRAYQGDGTRQLALKLGYWPVVPPLRTRFEPWEYDREMYKRRNEIERLFRRSKGFRRIFSRFEKLDVVFLGFIVFALIVDGLRSC